MLLTGAVEPDGVWVDLGAGGGTFTRALASLLGPDGVVIAVDSDKRAVRELAAIGHEPDAARIDAALGDFHHLDEIPGLTAGSLDGALLANALHFSPAAASVIAMVSISWMAA